jgi:hypothetical protein
MLLIGIRVTCKRVHLRRVFYQDGPKRTNKRSVGRLSLGRPTCVLNLNEPTSCPILDATTRRLSPSKAHQIAATYLSPCSGVRYYLLAGLRLATVSSYRYDELRLQYPDDGYGEPVRSFDVQSPLQRLCESILFSFLFYCAKFNISSNSTQ